MKKFIIAKTDFYWDIVLAAVLICISLICFMKFPLGYLSHDDQCFVFDGWRILHHGVPYRDFIDNKPPVVFFVNALGIMLFGLKNFGFKWMPFIPVCFSLVLFFFSMRKLRVEKIYAFFIALNFIYLIFHRSFHDGTLNDTETYGMSFSLIAFSFIHWNVFDSGRCVNLMKFTGGVFAALAVMTKEPFLLVVVPMVVLNYLFEGMNSVEQRNKRFLMVFIGAGLTGFGILGYLFFNGALIPYLTVVKEDLVYSKYYAQDLGRFVNGSFGENLKFDISSVYSGYNGGAYFFALAPFYAAFFWRWKWSFFTVLNILGIFLGAYAVSMGHCFWRHYYIMGFLPFILPAVYGAVFISDALRKYSFVLGIFFIVWAVFLFTYRIWSVSEACKAVEMGNDFYPLPRELKMAVDKYTSKDDSILLLTSQPYYYVALDRRNSFRRVEFVDELIREYDGNTGEEKLRLTKLEIEKNLPKLIFLENGWLFPEQQKHLKQVFIPLIRGHGYRTVGNGIFVLP